MTTVIHNPSSPNRDSMWTFSRVFVWQKQPDFSSYFLSVCCVSFAELFISQHESTAKGSWKKLCQLLATASKTRLLLKNVQNCTKWWIKKKKKKWKVLMENPLFCVRVIGLHFNAIFVSKGSQTFTLHSLVSFAFLWVHPFIVHIEIGNSSCKNKNLLKFLKPSMV